MTSTGGYRINMKAIMIAGLAALCGCAVCPRGGYTMEHTAIDVADPVATANWWVDLFGRGWYRDADIWKVRSELNALDCMLAARKGAYASEIASVVR